MHEISTQDRNIAFLIFGVLLACYLLTYTGLIDSSDGLSMFATTESMVRRGALNSDQLLWMGLQQGNFGPDGSLYSRKGVGMALLAYPLVRMAQVWRALGLVQAALLLNPLLTALTGALVYRIGRRLAWRPSTALAVALIFGLGTIAWPYTQGFFSDPICGWGFVAALYGLLAHRQSGRKRYLLAAGAAWGLVYLARTINLITLPIFVSGLYLVLRERERESVSATPPLRLLIERRWRPIISFLLPVVIAGLVSLWWNWARYGSLWATGYVESESFSGDWFAGLYGLILGPARGFFWYSPILLIAFWGLGWYWRNARWLLGLIVSLALVYVAVYAKWYMWHGGYSWGPRFLVPIVPLVSLLIGPAWDVLVTQRLWGWTGRVVVLALLILSIGVQWLGMLVPFSLVQEWLATNYTPLFAAETFTQVKLSPLVLQWQYLRPELIQLAWWRGADRDWAALFVTGASSLLGIILLTRALRARTFPGYPVRTRSNWLYGLFLCIIAVALLLRYQAALTDPAQRLVADRIAQVEHPQDALLFLQPDQYQQFANVYHGWLPVYGMSATDKLDASDQVWLKRMTTAHPWLWVIPDQMPPEKSGWERPLRTDHFLLQETRLPDNEGNRLALYASADTASLVESGLGTIFGDPARVDENVNADNGWIRLNGYALTTASSPGDAILLALRWQSLRPVGYDYHVFVHLLDSRGEKVAQRDGQPVQWLRPTSSWQAGEEITDHYGLLLPDDLSLGEYTVAVGLYDPVSGQRLPISAGPGDFAIELGPVEIKRGT